MQIWRSSLYLMGLVGLCLISAPDLGAEEPQPSDKGAIVEGAGFTLYDMESIKGSDAERVERDPVCDRSKRPKIHKVEPDEAKPGQKVTIKGENFGTKECFHGVAFSAAGPAKIDYKFVNETHHRSDGSRRQSRDVLHRRCGGRWQRSVQGIFGASQVAGRF